MRNKPYDPSPWSILKHVIQAVPAVKYGLAFAGIVSVIAIIKGLILGFQVAVFGTVGMLVLMTVLVIFARLSVFTSTSKVAVASLYFSLLLTVATAILLFTSVFVAWPVHPQSWLWPEGVTDHAPTPTPIGYFRNNHLDSVIVFVSGLFGDTRNTWTNPRSNAFWPALIANDALFRNEDIYIYAHSASQLTEAYTLDELINVMHERLMNDGVFSDHRRVIFLCHSL